MRVVPTPMANVYKRQKRRQGRREDHVRMEVGTALTQPQAEGEYLEPPRAEETKKESPLESSKGEWPCQDLNFCPVILILDFWPPEL